TGSFFVRELICKVCNARVDAALKRAKFQSRRLNSPCFNGLSSLRCVWDVGSHDLSLGNVAKKVTGNQEFAEGANMEFLKLLCHLCEASAGKDNSSAPSSQLVR